MDIETNCPYCQTINTRTNELDRAFIFPSECRTVNDMVTCGVCKKNYSVRTMIIVDSKIVARESLS